jgi:pimeloyl-ACP methyl ester carboxylesterase
MSNETLPGAGARVGVAGAAGIVVLAHGGSTVSRIPTTPVQLSVLRMIPVADAIRDAVGGNGIEVRRVRFRLRGWNGAEASPVRDLTGLLDQISADTGPVPVVLVGHSMGARAALRAAGHPLVTAVAGLAPWVPPGEPVDQLAGRRTLLIHASSDRICSPAETWAYAERARSAGEVATIEVRHGDHGMLRRARLWHALAGEFARLSTGRGAGTGPVADAFARASAGLPRTVL